MDAAESEFLSEDHREDMHVYDSDKAEQHRIKSFASTMDGVAQLLLQLILSGMKDDVELAKSSSAQGIVAYLSRVRENVNDRTSKQPPSLNAELQAKQEQRRVTGTQTLVKLIVDQLQTLSDTAESAHGVLKHAESERDTHGLGKELNCFEFNVLCLLDLYLFPCCEPLSRNISRNFAYSAVHYPCTTE